MKNLYKKIISSILSITIVASSFMFVPQKTEAIDLSSLAKGFVIGYGVCYAQSLVTMLPSMFLDVLNVPTGGAGDKSITASTAGKECGFDYAANYVKQELISGILRSTTEWVKGGYKGKPSFLTNPDQFLEEATDRYVGRIIENNEYTKHLCDSYQIPLKFAVNLQFYGKDLDQVPTCTLSDVEKNVDNALGDLKNFYSTDGELDSKSFWNAFVNTSTDNNNNPYGAFLELSSDLERKISKENTGKLDDVKRNGGFMSVETCDDENDDTYTGDVSKRLCGDKLERCLKNAKNDTQKESCNTQANSCINNSVGERNCTYVTPGTVVENKINATLGMEESGIQLADEFDELIAAVITNLMSKVLDSNKGLTEVNRTGDGSDFESATPKDISAEKSSMLKQYSPRSYDIQLKIYQSLLDAIEGGDNYLFNPVDTAKEELEFWKGKNDSGLNTEARLRNYWEASGHNIAPSKNWSTAFISYVTGGDIKFTAGDSGIMKKEFTTNKYVAGEAALKEGSVICNLEHESGVYCSVVVDIKNNVAILIGVSTPDENSNRGLIGIPLSLVAGGIPVKTNMMVFTPPEITTNKYNSDFYNNLFDGDYAGGTGSGLGGYNKNAIPNAYKEWKEFKEEYSKGDDGDTYHAWGRGAVKSYNPDGNYNFVPFPVETIDHVLQKFRNGGSGLSEEDLDTIKKMRDKTIRDRESAYQISEKIKSVSTMQELWDVDGSNIKSDLNKAYKIYQIMSAKIGQGVLGEPGTTEEGEPGYKGGLGAYAVIIKKAFVDRKHIKEKESFIASGGGATPESKVVVSEPMSIEKLDEWAMDADEIEKLGIKEFELEYDPIDDIQSLNSGLYDEDNYDYSSI